LGLDIDREGPDLVIRVRRSHMRGDRLPGASTLRCYRFLRGRAESGRPLL